METNKALSALDFLLSAIPAQEHGSDQHIAVSEAQHEIRQALAKNGDGWRPIDSAPKDGTRILVAMGSGKMTVCRWEEWKTVGMWIQYGGEGTGLDTIKLGGETEPTHWQPLPQPPEREARS